MGRLAVGIVMVDSERTNRNNLYQEHLLYLFMYAFLAMVLVMPGTLAEKAGSSDSIASGPDPAIIEAGISMDISEMEDIPLGTIPNEVLKVTIKVQNRGNREAPGYKVRAYLVRAGREDEIGTQLGGDITDTHLGAGETRTYAKTWAMPQFLKKGEYRLLITLDTSNYFIESDTSNNRYLSEKPIVPGVLTGPSGAVPVYSPAEITQPGYYVLKRDIDGGKKNNIFVIKASGVTFDGGGNTIRGTPNGFTNAVYVDAGVALRDITIKNLTVEGLDTGIWLFKANNGKVTGCTFRNMKNLGLRLDQSHQNEISGNTFDQNNMGIGIFQSNGNVIYNNYLKNQFNAVANDDLKNQWNTNLTGGTNILGGDHIGGNAWFDITGGGFSTTAQDLKTPGISDTPYSLNPNNIDFYPLKAPTSPNRPAIPLAEVTETTVTPEEPVSVTDSAENPDETLSQAATPKPTPVSPPVTTVSETPEVQNINIANNEKPDSRYADIGVKQVLAPESTCPGSDLNFSVIFENLGAYDADSFQVRYFLSEDKQGDAQDIPLGEETIRNLPAGGELTQNETCTIPASIGLKNYFIIVDANTGNDVFEDKKDNNNGYSPERVEIRSC